jgi:transposase
MHSVGIDLHRERSHVAILDDQGRELRSRRIINDGQTILALLAEIDGECRVALEATYGWEWLADVLQDAGYELHLAHPLRTKAIASARVKTDAVDARTLAHLLRTDLLPEAYIAPREIRDLRDLLRHRVALTRMRSALKNRVSAIPAKQGIQRPYSDLFGPAGTRFLAELELPEQPRRRLDSLLALIDDFTREIDHTTQEIEQRASEDPYVEVLCQIRGVGRYIAMLVIAEVGDITRFHTARQLCAWAGMTPTVRSSDHRIRLGHISHQGSPALRWALVEAAQHAARGGGPLRQTYERIAKRRGKQVAKIAVARKILTLCFYGLRDGEIRCLAPRARRARSDRRRSPHDPPRRSCANQPDGERPLERARVLSMASTPTRTDGMTAAHLIEPSSPARHSGPPSATGWMTGTLPPTTRPSPTAGRPTTRGP